MRATDITSAGRRRRLRAKRFFTLIEMLVAMAVLVILMGILFGVLSGSQNAYSLAETNAQTYERAHILFEQMSRDLRSAVACNLPGREIPIWVPPAAGAASYQPAADPPQSVALCLVSAGDPYNGDAVTRTNKIRYCFHTNTRTSGSPPAYVYANPYTITRSIDPERTASGPNANWNFYMRTAATETLGPNGVPDWVTNSGSARALIGGVEEFTIEPFPTTARGTRNVLPQAFTVTVTLVDERALALPDGPLKTERLAQSRRTFRKVIFLGGES